MTVLGYQLVAESLHTAGVDQVFGVLGEGNLHYVAEFAREGRYIATVDEGGAVGIADGFARFSGTIGVAAVTHGPAMTNAITALTEAARARSRVLLITASTPPVRRHLQRYDLEAAVAPTGAAYLGVDNPNQLRDALADAMGAAGPTVLDIPLHVQLAETDGLGETSRTTSPVPPVGTIDEGALDAALGILTSARHPLVLAGRGAIAASEALVELARLTGAWLGTTVLAKDLFHEREGVLGIVGSVATPQALAAMSVVDCVVAFGTSLDSFTTLNGALLRGRRLIRCDLRPDSQDDWPVDVAFDGDATVVARAMVTALQDAGVSPVAASFVDTPEPAAPRAGFVLESVVQVLDRELPGDRVLVTDTGRFKGPVWQGLTVRSPDHFTHTVGFGALGLGLSCSIGAALARPSELTVCVSGDGGFMMGAIELSTASRLHVPLLVVVMNDHAYGAEFGALRSLGLPIDLARMAWPSLAGIAESLGCRAREARTLKEFQDAIRWVAEERASGSAGPFVIDVVLDTSP